MVKKSEYGTKIAVCTLKGHTMDVFVLVHLQYKLSFETIFSVTMTVLFIMIEIKTVFFVLTVNGGLQILRYK